MTRWAFGEVHSLPFVVRAIRSYFRIHLTEITGNFVEYVYSTNLSITTEALLLTYKLEMEGITLLGGNQRIK